MSGSSDGNPADRFEAFIGPCEVAPPPAEPRWRCYALAATALLAAVGVVLASWLVGWLIDERRAATVDQAGQQLAALADGKAESLSIWLDGMSNRGNSIARSDLVSLYMTEQALAATDQALAATLTAQAPYLRAALDALARDHDLRGAYLLTAQGRIVMRDRNAQSLPAPLVSTMIDEATGGRPHATLRQDGARMLIDLLRAIPSTLSDAANPQTAAGYLLMTAEVSQALAALLTTGSAPAHTSLALIADAAPAPLEIQAPADRLRSDDGSDAALIVQPADDRRPPRFDPATTLLQRASVAGTDWTVVARLPLAPLLQPIDALARTSHVLAIAIGLGSTLAAAALFWRQRARQSRQLVDQYRQLAEEIARRGALLRTVVRASSDLILVRDAATRAVVFANPALRRWVGPLDGADGFSSGALEAFACSTATVGDAAPLAIEAADGRRWLHVHHARIEDRREADPVAGALDASDRREPDFPGGLELTIARDVSALVEAHARHRRSLDQTITALSRAVELADPYLDGHTARVRGVCAGLAEALRLPADARQTLDQAAALSQIGKLFVAPALLRKDGRHDEAEAAAMLQHINHALRLIRPIEFDLPVAETLACMHERLDGTGYPRGLQADAIPIAGRILAVADVFCARIRPRRYRHAITPAEACRILLGLADRYDRDVVTALDRLVGHGELSPLLDLDHARPADGTIADRRADGVTAPAEAAGDLQPAW